MCDGAGLFCLGSACRVVVWLIMLYAVFVGGVVLVLVSFARFPLMLLGVVCLVLLGCVCSGWWILRVCSLGLVVGDVGLVLLVYVQILLVACVGVC